MGDTGSAVTCYEESAEFLSKLPTEDLEVGILIFDLKSPTFENIM